MMKTVVWRSLLRPQLNLFYNCNFFSSYTWQLAQIFFRCHWLLFASTVLYTPTLIRERAPTPSPCCYVVFLVTFPFRHWNHHVGCLLPFIPSSRVRLVRLHQCSLSSRDTARHINWLVTRSIKRELSPCFALIATGACSLFLFSFSVRYVFCSWRVVDILPRILCPSLLLPMLCGLLGCPKVMGTNFFISGSNVHASYGFNYRPSKISLPVYWIISWIQRMGAESPAAQTRECTCLNSWQMIARSSWADDDFAIRFEECSAKRATLERSCLERWWVHRETGRSVLVTFPSGEEVGQQPFTLFAGVFHPSCPFVFLFASGSLC